jgi:hypothetical protein
MNESRRAMKHSSNTFKACKQSALRFRFRCNVGLAGFAAIYMATVAAAFSGNAYKATFVRRDRCATQSTALITPLLFNNNGPLARLSMSNDDESATTDDQDEWSALIAAFQMYRAAYGDLRVPLRFIVPSMPPWPSKSTTHRRISTGDQRPPQRF